MIVSHLNSLMSFEPFLSQVCSLVIDTIGIHGQETHILEKKSQFYNILQNIFINKKLILLHLSLILISIYTF
jgi:hypothetical protein